MRIAQIRRRPSARQQINIECDDGTKFIVHEEVVAQLGLRKDDQLTGDAVNKLAAAEEISRAKEKALRFISYRLRTVKEVRRKLTEHEFLPSVIDRVIEQLLSIRVLDDQAFAEAYIRDALAHKPAGGKLIRQRLRLLGVDNQIIDQAIHTSPLTDEELPIAQEAAAKYMRKMEDTSSRLSSDKRRQRLTNFLARRGFSWNTISAVVKETFPR